MVSAQAREGNRARFASGSKNCAPNSHYVFFSARWGTFTYTETTGLRGSGFFEVSVCCAEQWWAE